MGSNDCVAQIFDEVGLLHHEFPLGTGKNVTRGNKLPISLSSRSERYILFSLVQSCGHCLYSLHWPGEYYTAHRNPYKIHPAGLKFQSLSFRNTEIYLMRNYLLQTGMPVSIITVSQGGTLAITQTQGCVFIPDESAKCTIFIK